MAGVLPGGGGTLDLLIELPQATDGCYFSIATLSFQPPALSSLDSNNALATSAASSTPLTSAGRADIKEDRKISTSESTSPVWGGRAKYCRFHSRCNYRGWVGTLDLLVELPTAAIFDFLLISQEKLFRRLTNVGDKIPATSKRKIEILPNTTSSTVGPPTYCITVVAGVILTTSAHPGLGLGFVLLK